MSFGNNKKICTKQSKEGKLTEHSGLFAQNHKKLPESNFFAFFGSNSDKCNQFWSKNMAKKFGLKNVSFLGSKFLD